MVSIRNGQRAQKAGAPPTQEIQEVQASQPPEKQAAIGGLNEVVPEPIPEAAVSPCSPDLLGSMPVAFASAATDHKASTPESAVLPGPSDQLPVTPDAGKSSAPDCMVSVRTVRLKH
jgi:hypothetical protein